MITIYLTQKTPPRRNNDHADNNVNEDDDEWKIHNLCVIFLSISKIFIQNTRFKKKCNYFFVVFVKLQQFVFILVKKIVQMRFWAGKNDCFGILRKVSV